MALTFPRAMPDQAIADLYFEPERIDYASPEARGRQASVQAGFPLWRMAFNFGRQEEQVGAEWRAFVRSLRGASRAFFGWDPARPLPLLYAAGLPDGWNGDAASWAVNADRDVLTLQLGGARAGFQLSIGDYVGFRWGGGDKRALVACLEDGVADGSGQITVTVDPAVPGGITTIVPADAVAQLDKPRALFKLIAGETRIGRLDGLHMIDGEIAAIQELVP